MDITTSRILAALKSEIQTHLVGLGEYPKADQFEHGVAVGTYRGLNIAIGIIEQVLDDIIEEDLRR